MSQQVTIYSVSAQTPVSIYYSGYTDLTPQLVQSGVTFFPYTFIVPSPSADDTFIVRIVDNVGCILDGLYWLVTPTQTPTNTSTPTQTV